jgi:hypothetical protein
MVGDNISFKPNGYTSVTYAAIYSSFYLWLDHMFKIEQSAFLVENTVRQNPVYHLWKCDNDHDYQ